MTNNLNISNTGLTLISSFESFAKDNGDGTASPYLDQKNIPTIGYGSTYYQDGSRVTLNDQPITREQALGLLYYACNNITSIINDNVTTNLNQNQFDALCSLIYNIGAGNFLHSSVLATLNSGDFTNIPSDFMMWDEINHQISNGLVRRRQAEIQLFNS